MQRQDRILVVDDNPTNIAVMEEILADTYILETSRSGEDALARAPRFRPDLVLLDVMMPGINGYEVCRRLRAEPSLRHTKIIIVSARALASERLKGHEAGADDYLTKPFEEDELLAKVRVYLQLQKVEEADELKSDILALLGHETRTPLNEILDPAQRLMAPEPMGAAERISLAQTIHQRGSRLRAYLEKIRILSALESGAFPFHFDSVDLADPVRAAAEAMTRHAAAGNITIHLDLDNTLSLTLDPDHIQTVIVALLDNAIRFSPSGGQVTVAVARDADRALVHVRDNGPGLDADLLIRVFERVTGPDTAHQALKQGVSLAIARRIVQGHGGDISVSSRKGEETVFSVALPLAGPPASAAQEGTMVANSF